MRLECCYFISRLSLDSWILGAILVFLLFSSDSQLSPDQVERAEGHLAFLALTPPEFFTFPGGGSWGVLIRPPPPGSKTRPPERVVVFSNAYRFSKILHDVIGTSGGHSSLSRRLHRKRSGLTTTCGCLFGSIYKKKPT